MLPSTRISKFGRIAVGTYLAVWAAVIVGSWIYWNDMSFGLKALIVALELFFIPDVASIREYFNRTGDQG